MTVNVISLNTPFPPNYGGVIDIFYLIKALKRLGVKIILHSFEYERPRASELQSLCAETYYYKRQTGIAANLSLLPYNVVGRRDPQLLKHLLENEHPIIFESLHSCYFMNAPQLNGRLKIFRPGNIEHDYYQFLAKACRNPISKTFHRLEAWKFKQYEHVLKSANIIVPISETDTAYMQTAFPNSTIQFIPAFHANESVKSCPGIGNFILYHAKLSVHENEQIALFLTEKIFSKLRETCVIAGMNPSQRIRQAISTYPNIQLEANPDSDRMEKLIKEAHIHILPTFQPTGLKLKLLNSLFEGRHIIANRPMLAGSGLDELCHIADTSQEILHVCRQLMQQPFSTEEIEQRRQRLIPFYTSSFQARELIRLISVHTSA
jgi:hypothetical protein